MPHSIDKLSEDTRGEMLIPGEKENLVVDCSLRHFVLQANRNYTQVALENMPGMRVRENAANDIFSDNEPNDFVVLDFKFKPHGDLRQFAQGEEGDEFFEDLIEILAYNDRRNLRGNRGVFVTEFTRQQAASSEFFTAKIVLSTTVFYNDYRATVNYPSNQKEVEDAVEEIYTRLINKYPDMQFEMFGQFVE